MTRRYDKLALIGLLLMCSMAEANAEVVMVVGRNSPIQSLSRHEVNDIFLGNATRLPAIGKVVPLDRNEDRLRADFYRDFTGRDLPQVKAHWAKNIFTGRGYPPRTVDSVEELREVLQKNPNAISYVTPDKVDESMKVLTVK
jgi:ABC-type phosphate transport system substrate-binding protein